MGPSGLEGKISVLRRHMSPCYPWLSTSKWFSADKVTNPYNDPQEVKERHASINRLPSTTESHSALCSGNIILPKRKLRLREGQILASHPAFWCWEQQGNPRSVWWQSLCFFYFHRNQERENRNGWKMLSELKRTYWCSRPLTWFWFEDIENEVQRQILIDSKSQQRELS